MNLRHKGEYSSGKNARPHPLRADFKRRAMLLNEPWRKQLGG
jgi:hypothetical protein